MATKLEKLMFRIGVKDDASGPVGKLQKALRSTSRMSKQAWGQLAGGAMTAAGAGLALEGMVSPALDLNRALADVSSYHVKRHLYGVPFLVTAERSEAACEPM